LEKVDSKSEILSYTGFKVGRIPLMVETLVSRADESRQILPSFYDCAPSTLMEPDHLGSTLELRGRSFQGLMSSFLILQWYPILAMTGHISTGLSLNESVLVVPVSKI
jgi:hypothetical protein